MKLAGCFNDTKTSYMPIDQGKFDFSCHDPFNNIIKRIMIIPHFCHNTMVQTVRITTVNPWTW